MTVYCVGTAHIKDKEKLAEYKNHAPEALKKHQGNVVASSMNLVRIDGSNDSTNLNVVLSFPSRENALNWRKDTELSHVHNMRNSAGDWEFHLLD